MGAAFLWSIDIGLCGARAVPSPKGLYHFSPSNTGDKPTSLLQPHELRSGSAEAQLLLKQLAGIVAQNPQADRAL